MAKRKHIDDVQPSTVDEHFKLLLEDQTVIEKEFHRITKNDLPEWFDEELFKAGQAFYMKNVLSIGIAQVTGLLSILCVPEISEVLIFTKHSNSSCLTFKRYAQTLLLIYQLFYSDINDSNSLLNLCRKTEAETTQLCMRVSREIIKVQMEAPTPELTQLLKNTLNGLWYIDHTMDSDAVLAFTYRMEGAEWKKPLSLYSRFNTQYGKAIVKSMSLPYLGTIFRILFNNIYMISYWALKTCPLAAWMVFGKQGAALQLYPLGS